MIEFWTSVQMLAVLFGFLGCGALVGSAIECDNNPTTSMKDCPVVMIDYTNECAGRGGCITPPTRIVTVTANL